MEILVETTLSQHLYKWGQHIRRQSEGGAIGLRATGSIAQVVMDDWLKSFIAKLEDCGVKVWLLKKYVDDVLIVCEMLKKGAHYVGGKIEYTDVSKDEDSNRSKPEVTLNL